MKSSVTSAALFSSLVLSQAITCPEGLSSGRDEVIFTVPYTYTQVLSIIGNYSNLTWSGSPAGSVTLNGSDNTVGTARSYSISGAAIVETIITYSKPADGPYVEIHDLALTELAALNLSLSAPYDGTTLTSVCDGKAATFNFTALYCANNVTTGGAVLHMAHMGDAQTVGVFLGGMNYTNCAALNTPTSSPTTTSTPSTYTGGAVRNGGFAAGGMLALVGALLL